MVFKKQYELSHLSGIFKPDNEYMFLVSHRDVAKNALLRLRAFIYWTFLGVFDAVVFFFGAYLLLDNTVVTSNGQVSVGFHLSVVIFLNANCKMNIVLIVFFNISCKMITFL